MKSLVELAKEEGYTPIQTAQEVVSMISALGGMVLDEEKQESPAEFLANDDNYNYTVQVHRTPKTK